MLLQDLEVSRAMGDGLLLFLGEDLLLLLLDGLGDLVGVHADELSVVPFHVVFLVDLCEVVVQGKVELRLLRTWIVVLWDFVLKVRLLRFFGFDFSILERLLEGLIRLSPHLLLSELLQVDLLLLCLLHLGRHSLDLLVVGGLGLGHWFNLDLKRTFIALCHDLAILLRLLAKTVRLDMRLLLVMLRSPLSLLKDLKLLMRDLALCVKLVLLLVGLVLLGPLLQNLKVRMLRCHSFIFRGCRLYLLFVFSDRSDVVLHDRAQLLIHPLEIALILCVSW